MMTRQQKRDLLVFRLKNIFLNNQTEVYRRKDISDMFPYTRESLIIAALESLVANKNISRNTYVNRYVYQYKKIRTRKSNSHEDLFNSVDPDMTFGVEFEFGCHIDADEMTDMLEEAGFDVHNRSSHFSDYSKWNVINDASVIVKGYIEDIEIVSPILRGKRGLEELKKMTSFINSLKKMGIARQNRTCGTHVHHSAKKFTAISKLIYAGEMTQTIMNQFVTKHRAMSDDQIVNYENNVDTVYQAPIKKEKYFEGKSLKISHEKYINLNITKFRKYGTVEFRQLQGTTQFRKIASWIIMAQKLIRGSRKFKRNHTISSTNDFFTYFNIDKPSIQKSLVA